MLLGFTAPRPGLARGQGRGSQGRLSSRVAAEPAAFSSPCRYLYVNSRAWPQGCVISDPLQPPPIAEEIDLHVLDLKTMKEVKRALRAHRAYTPSGESFFIFLDVSRDFVAR